MFDDFPDDLDYDAEMDDFLNDEPVKVEEVKKTEESKSENLAMQRNLSTGSAKEELKFNQHSSENIF